MELSLPNLVYIVDIDSDRDTCVAIQEPSVREYTILSHLQSASRLDYIPFSVAPKDNPHDKLHCNKLVPDEASQDFRALHLYQLLHDIANDTEGQTIEWLSGEVHSDDPFEQADIEGMQKAVDLMGGFDALEDLVGRISVEYMNQMPKEPVPTVFVCLGYEGPK
jgi:hypothetical protein